MLLFFLRLCVTSSVGFALPRPGSPLKKKEYILSDLIIHRVHINYSSVGIVFNIVSREKIRSRLLKLEFFLNTFLILSSTLYWFCHVPTSLPIKSSCSTAYCIKLSNKSWLWWPVNIFLLLSIGKSKLNTYFFNSLTKPWNEPFVDVLLWLHNLLSSTAVYSESKIMLAGNSLEQKVGILNPYVFFGRDYKSFWIL